MGESNTCIIVADGARARFFTLRPEGGARRRRGLQLLADLDHQDFRARGAGAPHRTKTEQMTNRQTGAAHPIGERRERHRLELERRFAAAVAQQAADIAAGWSTGVVVLIADPRILGLLREAVRGALDTGIELKELAKDYTKLTLQELERRLILNRLLPLGPLSC